MGGAPEGRRPRWYDYFRYPFPSSEGFSAYRFPGVAVHIPVFLTFLMAWAFVCAPAGRPVALLTLPFFLVFGLYFGRDIAIMCHYAPVLTLLTWGAFFTVLTFGVRLGKALSAHPALRLGLALALTAGFAALLAALIRGMLKDE